MSEFEQIINEMLTNVVNDNAAFVAEQMLRYEEPTATKAFRVAIRDEAPNCEAYAGMTEIRNDYADYTFGFCYSKEEAEEALSAAFNYAGLLNDQYYEEGGGAPEYEELQHLDLQLRIRCAKRLFNAHPRYYIKKARSIRRNTIL